MSSLKEQTIFSPFVLLYCCTVESFAVESFAVESMYRGVRRQQSICLLYTFLPYAPVKLFMCCVGGKHFYLHFVLDTK